MVRTSPPEDSLISLALARQSYLDRKVRLVDSDISGYSHVVATRNGLYVANENELKLICYGLFFGLVARPGCLYVFECCDLPRSRTSLGRIVRFGKSRHQISDIRILAEGLDNGCHQMDIIDDRLLLVDTYQQRILSFSIEGGNPIELRPLPAAEVNDWQGGYKHVNSITRVGDQLMLLLHNGAKHTGEFSEIAVFDMDWRRQGTWTLPGLGCHDIAILEDGRLLTCGSIAGELIISDGRRIKITELMTRGLSVDNKMIVVGSSAFSLRKDRTSAEGVLSFLNHDLEIMGRMEISASPTDICRLDGQDRSLSEFLAAHGPAAIDHERVRWPGAFKKNRPSERTS